MSLINQMLKDLETRNASQLNEHAETIKGVTWSVASKSRHKRRYILATVAVSVFCTGIAAGSYYHFSNGANSESINRFSIEAPRVSNAMLPTVATKSVIHTREAHVEISSEKQTRVGHSALPSISGNKPLTRPELTEAHKMLAALVAQGALSVNKSKPVKPTKVLNKPVELSVAVKTEKRIPSNTLEKKLRPLDNNKLAEIAYQEGYEKLARGQAAAAEKKLKRALILQPTLSKAREMLAVMYLREQRIQNAAEVLTQGMRLLPEHFAFREIYARVLMEQKKLPEAIAMLKEAAPELDVRPNYYALLAGLYQQNKQYEEAATIYLKLVKKNPQYSHWWLGLAIAMEKMGKNVEAISAYKKARELKLPARLMTYVNNRLQILDPGNATTP